MQSNERVELYSRRNKKSMDSRPTTQDELARSIRCLPFLLLALMVFAWGTGYKLSLYKALREDGSTPAKLCTRVGEAARSALLDATGDHALIADHGLVALPPLSTLLCTSGVASHDLRRRSLEDDGQSMNPSPFHPPAALDLRPPPQ